MPTFLSDPPLIVYVMLTLAVIISGSMWFNRRTQQSVIGFGSFVALLALLVLLDWLFESPREESVRRVLAMTHAADARDSEAFLSNIADSFEYEDVGRSRTISREALRTSAIWEILRQNNVHTAAWDFDRSDVVEVDANTIEIGFLAKGETTNNQVPIYLRAKFTRQQDGQMKLTGLASFDPMKRTNERLSIPYLP
jgi:hypothetical protein